eukprot:1428804-Lingulodinium_polyedra.AAC.1
MGRGRGQGRRGACVGARRGDGSRRGGRRLHSRRGPGLAQGVRPRTLAGGYRGPGASRRAL